MVVFYALFLGLLTAFGVKLAYSDELTLELEDKLAELSARLSAIWLCGLRMVYRECMQLKTSIQDGKNYFDSRLIGLKYFLCQWNWVIKSVRRV